MKKESHSQRASIQDVKTHKRSLSHFISRWARDAHLSDPPMGSWIEQRSVEKYNQRLPDFQARSFQDRLKKLPSGSLLLDYGCGDTATALQEIQREHPHIVCEGVTYPVARSHIEPVQNCTIYRQDGDVFLTQHTGRYDIITAVQSIRYAPDQLGTIKRAYRALKPGGVLLVDLVSNASMPLVGKNGKMVDPHSMQEQLEKAGYRVEITTQGEPPIPYAVYSFAIEKLPNRPTLKLPLSLIRIPELTYDSSQRADTEFALLGFFLPNIQYVYRLEE